MWRLETINYSYYDVACKPTAKLWHFPMSTDAPYAHQATAPKATPVIPKYTIANMYKQLASSEKPYSNISSKPGGVIVTYPSKPTLSPAAFIRSRVDLLRSLVSMTGGPRVQPISVDIRSLPIGNYASASCLFAIRH
jgi:spore germination cell wall hydrolase CwlJ-like protein